MPRKIFKFSIKQYIVHAYYKYILGWIIPLFTICFLVFLKGTFGITHILVVGVATLLISLMFFVGRLIAWKKARIELSNNSISYAFETEGMENLNYKKRIFVQTTLSIKLVKKHRHSLKIVGIIQKYDYNQTDSKVKEKQFNDNSMVIPLYFSESDELINEIKKMIGDNYYD